MNPRISATIAWFRRPVPAFGALLIGVSACYCRAPDAPAQTALLSNRPLVILEQDGGQFGISGDVDGGAPLLMPVGVRVDNWECQPLLAIDQKYGARCVGAEEPSSANPEKTPSDAPDAPTALQYCSDEWVVRVVVKPCSGAGDPTSTRFRIIQIAVRDQAKLK